MENNLNYKKAILELIQLRTTCRLRGLDTDIKTQSNTNFFMGAKDEMHTFHRHLDDLKWIIVDIECAMKYLNEDERKKFKKLVKEIKEAESFVGHVKTCINSEFHGIECLELDDEYGFEGCYNNKIDHPDPRPGHRIWIKKLYAEKLYRLFAKTQEKVKK